MSWRKRSHFTFLLITDENSRIRKFNLPHNFLRLIFIIISIFAVTGVILVSNLFITRQKLNDTIEKIERETEKINYQLVSLSNLEQKTKDIQTKTKILENYLSQVEDLDKLVRDITGKGGFEEQVELYNYDLNAAVNAGEDTEELLFYTNTQDQEQELEDIDLLLDELLIKAPGMSSKLSEDKLNMENYIYELEHTPNLWPSYGRITTLFCDGRAKIWRAGLHKGIDIANRSGTPINSSAAGVVIFAGLHAGYGRKVIVFHGFGYTTVYAHLLQINVNVGDEVTKGEVIGLMGSSGRSTGTHLHFEIYENGSPVNPFWFLS